jgi:hypothetical protein
MTSTSITFSACCRNGSASRTARRASRTSFQATATRLGTSEDTARHDQNGTADLEQKLAGVERSKWILILQCVADDDEIGRARLARDDLRGKVQHRPPFHERVHVADGGAKRLSLLI